MLERGAVREAQEGLSPLDVYLGQHCLGTMFLSGELAYAQRARFLRRPETVVYEMDDAIGGVCGFIRDGRSFPHWIDERVIPAMAADMASRGVRMVSGLTQVVGPLVGSLERHGLRPTQDEVEILCQLEPSSFSPMQVVPVRRALAGDLDVVAELRTSFEAEYFGVPGHLIPPRWARRIAKRYIDDGAYLAEADGLVVAMAALEVDIPQLSLAAAVYTRRAYRRRGYAKSVVSALAEEAFLTKPLVVLTVRESNVSAMQAYRALGFRPVDAYRFVSLRPY